MYSNVLRATAPPFQDPGSTSEAQHQVEMLRLENAQLRCRLQATEERLFQLELERQIRRPIEEQQVADELQGVQAQARRDYNETSAQFERLEDRVLKFKKERDEEWDYLVQCIDLLAEGHKAQIRRLVRPERRRNNTS
jgi:hypothetical protein